MNLGDVNSYNRASDRERDRKQEENLIATRVRDEQIKNGTHPNITLCKKCSNEIWRSQNFCPNCGRKNLNNRPLRFFKNN